MKITDYLEYTLLNNDLTKDELLSNCSSARAYKYSGLCTTGLWTKMINKELIDSDVNTMTVIDFPYGSSSLKAQHCQIIDSVKANSETIYLCINEGLYRSMSESEYITYLRHIKMLTTKINSYIVIDFERFTINEIEQLLSYISEVKLTGVVFDFNNQNDFITNFELYSQLKVMTDDKLIIKVYDNNISYDNFQTLINDDVSKVLTSNVVQLIKDNQVMEGRYGTV